MAIHQGCNDGPDVISDKRPSVPQCPTAWPHRAIPLRDQLHGRRVNHAHDRLQQRQCVTECRATDCASVIVRSSNTLASITSLTRPASRAHRADASSPGYIVPGAPDAPAGLGDRCAPSQPGKFACVISGRPESLERCIVPTCRLHRRRHQQLCA